VTVTTTQDPVEAWLDSFRVTYSRETVPTSAIDVESSLKNQARVGAPLVDDQVAMYAAAMEKGDIFPPLILYKAGESKKYIAIDGNHRLAAGRSTNKTEFDAYVVDSPSDTQITLLTFEANVRHGLPTSIEERTQQALTLVEYGATQTAAAERLAIPINRVNDAYKQVRADRRAATLGVSRRWETLPISTRRAMNAVTNDAAFKALADLAIDSGMTSTDIQAFIPKLGKVGSEAAQVVLVNQERERRGTEVRDTAANRIKLPQHIRGLTWAVNRIRRFDPTDAQQPMPNDIKGRLVTSVDETIETLFKIREELTGGPSNREAQESVASTGTRNLGE
jgi:ParB-like chromosome segregation protein Spo0J